MDVDEAVGGAMVTKRKGGHPVGALIFREVQKDLGVLGDLARRMQPSELDHAVAKAIEEPQG